MGLYHQKIHVLSEMNKTIACTIAKAERELGYDPKVELERGNAPLDPLDAGQRPRGIEERAPQFP